MILKFLSSIATMVTSKPNSLLAVLVAFLAYGKLATVASATDYTIVNMRIEGPNATVFQGPILTSIHSVTTPSGGTHKCDGTNFNAYHYPVLTATAALDNASYYAKFKWDA